MAEGKRPGCEEQGTPNQLRWVCADLILLTACEPRKLRLWNGWLLHRGRRAGSEWDWGISAGVGPCLTEAHLRTRPQEKLVVGKRSCWMHRMEGKTPKLPEGRGPREKGTYCFLQEEEISVRSICVHKYIFPRLQ